MNKEFTLRSTNPSVETLKSQAIADIIQKVNAKRDFKVTITPLDFRGVGALRAYWMMIDSIVLWDAAENGLKKSYFHKEFMEEAGLYDEVDHMPYWKMRYKEKIKEGWKLHYWHDSGTYSLDKHQKGTEEIEEWVSLDYQYQKEIRSLANKGDITKDEMSRLLTAVIKFGAQNDVPDCFIDDREFKRMVEGCR